MRLKFPSPITDVDLAVALAIMWACTDDETTADNIQLLGRMCILCWYLGQEFNSIILEGKALEFYCGCMELAGVSEVDR